MTESEENILVGEDSCALSPDSVRSVADRYFSWNETYWNPQSKMYRRAEILGLSRLILFNFAQRDNRSFCTVEGEDPESSETADVFTVEEADFKLGVIYTPAALLQSDFTFPYGLDYITFCTKVPHGTPNTDGFIDVLSWEVWVALSLACLLCSLIMFLFSFSVFTKKFKVSVQDSFAFVLKNVIIHEGHDLREPPLAVQLVGMAWIFVAFVVTSQYVSTVVSSLLALDPPENVPEAFEDLARYGHAVETTDLIQKDVVQLLSTSRNKRVQRLASILTSASYTGTCMDTVLLEPGDLACIGKFRELQNMVDTRYLDEDTRKPLLRIPERHGAVIWLGYAFRKDMPVKDQISKYITAAMAAGLIFRWQTEEDDALRRRGRILSRRRQCENEQEIRTMWFEALPSDDDETYNCLHFHYDIMLEIMRRHCTVKAKVKNGATDSFLTSDHLTLVFQTYLGLHSLAFVVFFLEVSVGCFNKCKRGQGLCESSDVVSLVCESDTVCAERENYVFAW